MRNTILVTGATGAQGGSVARQLLNDGQFSVKCLTRNINSEKAQALVALGAKMVQGDMDDVESLKAAMTECYGVFGITNFWEHFAKEKEHGENLLRAVSDSNIQHFVFSTLPGAKKISKSELDVPHFDIKAELEEDARSLGLNITFIHVAFYYENFLSFFPPQPDESGNLSFGFPQGDTKLAGVSVEDTGGVVAALFNDPDKYIGKTVGIVGDDLPPAVYADQMSKAFSKEVSYNFIPREVFASFEFPGADDLANMFDFNRRFIPNRQTDLDESRKLYPAMQSFEKWVNENKQKFAST